MKELFLFFSNRNHYNDRIKYGYGVPNVNSNSIIKFELCSEGVDILNGDNGKKSFTILKNKVKSIEIKKEDNGKKTFLNFNTENEFGEAVISFYSDRSNSEQTFTDIKYNLLKFWKLLEENSDAENELKLIKEERDKKVIENANGCMIAFVILLGVFLLFWFFSGENKETENTGKTENISKVEIDSIIAETNKPKSKADIENLFSAWDGSLPSFKDYIKENLQNPDSFEHVETKFRDDGDGLTVIMKYRGENGFGAIRTQTAIAKVDYDGNILSLISNE